LGSSGHCAQVSPDRASAKSATTILRMAERLILPLLSLNCFYVSAFSLLCFPKNNNPNPANSFEQSSMFDRVFWLSKDQNTNGTKLCFGLKGKEKTSFLLL
jgi:hypothetical protein